MLKGLNDQHKYFTDAMHPKRLAEYYPDNYSSEASDCIAFNSLLNDSRLNNYNDIYGKCTQYPSTVQSNKVYYSDTVDTQYKLEPLDPLNKKVEIKTKTNLSKNANYREITVADKSEYPIALLPHQKQHQWPIDPFRFGQTTLELPLPSRKHSGYSSLGARKEEKKIESQPVPQPKPKSPSYYSWKRTK